MTYSNYQVGGSLQADHPTYVLRQADTELLNALQQGEFCYTFNARQMGKSSLMVRAKHSLEQLGWRCVVIDMTAIGSEFVTPEQWYKGLAYELWLGLNLTSQFKLKQWWQERQEFSYLQRLNLLIQEILLIHFPTQPLLILVDEIDSVLSLPFPIDDFFTLIRFCYNRRVVQADYHRLTFALFGVVTPTDLTHDPSKTPFNIGRAIELQGFQPDEVQPLIQALEGQVSNPQGLVREVLNWTGGQPFLTQKLCYLIGQAAQTTPRQFLVIPPGTEAFWIENLVQSRIIHRWASQDEPEHLRTIQDRVLCNEQRSGRLLGLYQQILQAEMGCPALNQNQLDPAAKSELIANSDAASHPITHVITHVATDDSYEQIELLLSGLVMKQQGHLRVKNRIYQQVFNLNWSNQALDTLRPYSQALTAWLASHQQDGSRLLRGQALSDAQTWAQGKNLSHLDYQFLAASQELQQQEMQQTLEAARVKEMEARLQVEQRSVKRQRLGLALVSLSLGLVSWLGVNTFRQYRQAAVNEIRAFAETSETFYASEQGLDALTTALEAKQKLQSIVGADSTTIDQVSKALRQAVYNTSEVNRLVGHQNSVLSVAVSPNAPLLASGSEDRTVRLWQQDGTPLKTLYGHSDRVESVSFSPDGRLLVSASADRTIILWDHQGKKLNRLIGHTGGVTAVAFSPEGHSLASASHDQTIRLWSTDGSLLTTLSGHRGAVRDLTFSSDGQRIASAGDDQTIKLWDRKGQLLKTLTGHGDRVRTIAFSPNNRTLISGSDDQTLKIWQLDGTLIRTLKGHQAAVQDIALNPYGQTLASASADGTIKLWNREGVLLSTLKGHSKSVQALAFSPDSRTIVSASNDETVRYWKVRNAFSTPLVGHEDQLTGVAFNPSDRSVVTSSEDRTLRIWNRRGSMLQVLSGHSSGVLDVAVSPDGRLIASASRDKTIKLWNQRGQLQQTLLGHQLAVQSVAFSPNGNLLASSSEDRTLKIWQQDGHLLRTLVGHVSPVSDLMFSSIQPLLASVSQDGAIKLWRSNAVVLSDTHQHHEPWRAEGDLLTSFGDYNAEIKAVAFSPTQQHLVTAWNKTIKLWQTDGTSLKTLRGHQGKVQDVAYSPDGQLIASASEDNTVKLWNWKGEELTTLDIHTSTVRAIAFSPDSQTLASVSDDRTGLLWDLQLVLNTNALQNYGCAWIQDYLKTSAEVDPSDRHLCRDLSHEPLK